jgi:hypothetical protein
MSLSTPWTSGMPSRSVVVSLYTSLVTRGFASDCGSLVLDREL